MGRGLYLKPGVKRMGLYLDPYRRVGRGQKKIKQKKQLKLPD